MAENTNLKLILNDILSISTGTWNKVKDVQIKSFAESDTISGSVSPSGVLNLGVKISNFVSNDVTNALTVRTGENPGLYVGLPVSSDGTSYGLIKAGTGVKVVNGVLSVDLAGAGSAEAVAKNLTVFGTPWNGLTKTAFDYEKGINSHDIVVVLFYSNNFCSNQ
jgi:hypothetical protein